MSGFSDMLAYLRKREGLSQQELADQLGVTRSRIGMYETAKREPDFEGLEAIADFFNVNMDTLMGKAPTPKDEHSSDPDIRRIERAKARMPEQEWNRQMKVIAASFGDYFSDDYEDDDVDE